MSLSLSGLPHQPPFAPRTDLFVTTAHDTEERLAPRAFSLAAELSAPVVSRHDEAFSTLFARLPQAERALVVQTGRLLLVQRSGDEFFYHPNMAYLRLGNLAGGGQDLLITATGIGPGDSVLDATLGFGAEAILCAHVVGDAGEVHGIEAVPELGVVVREGLRNLETERTNLNDAMRRIRVVYLGHHLDFLRACPARRYDVVCFDPFFDEILRDSETFEPLRAFGAHGPLTAEALAEARRVARRRVVVKAVRWSDTFAELGITERHASRAGKVAYGVIDAF